MYKKQTSILARQSQRWIADSFLLLMEKYTFHELTVTQICQESQLVRKTFYRNFETKVDILHFILDNIFASFQEKYDIQNMTTAEIFRHYYEYLAEHRKLLEYMYRDNMFYLISQKFIEYTKSIYMFNLVEQEILKQEGFQEVYVYQFIASGLLGILEIWIARNFEDSIDTLTRLTDTLIPKVYRNLKNYE